ncbi:MAG: c-type cytochrome [Bryobacterales bacterium]|nr:c-type cytochrome [Bryobacterales bacterium]
MKLLCTLSPFWVPLLLALGCGSVQSPPHSPEEALSTFALPESFRIELVAAEPDVIDPVAMAFDAQGRLYVVEMRDYPYHPEPQGQVKRLEDRDGDGRYEQVSIFAEGLSLPNGVMPWIDGVLVTAAPDILFLSDTDADGVADERSVVLTGFAATNPQLRVNGPLYGIDNWIYVAYTRVPNPVRFAKEFGDRGGPIRFPERTGAKSVEARSQDIRFRTDDSLVERVAGNSQFGNAFDAWGNRFTVWNNDHLRHVVVQEKYLVRNPYLMNPEAMKSVSDHEKAATLFQITTEPEYIHDSQHGRFTSASGISIYSGGLFPAGYEHTSFTCDPVHNVVHRDVLVADGPTFTAKRAHEGHEFLASTDSWFRPVFTTTGPDGALYVIDYHRPVVEHPEYAPKEIVDYIEFDPPAQAGRIYRIVYEGSEPYEPAKLGEASSEELVDALSHPNGWWRTTAQRLLVERSDRSVESALQELARENKAVAKLHALWTLDGLGSLSSDLVRDALHDPEPNVREHALQLAEGLLTEEELRREALRLAQDESAKVQLQAACILGSFPDRRARRALEQLLADNIESPWFRTAALSSAADNSDAWLARLLRRPGLLGEESEGKRAMLHGLASIAGTRQQDMQAAKLVEAVRQSSAVRGDWWRQAVLEGLREGIGQGEKERPRLAVTQRGLLALLSSPGETVRVGALDALLRIDVEATPQVDSILARAASIAADSLAPVEGRIFAVRTLGLDRSGQYTTDIAALLGPSHSEGLQVAAVETLSAVQGPDATESLLADWRSYTGPVRTAIIGELVGHTQGISALLNAVENETVQSWSLSRGRQRQLLRHADEEIRARAEALFGESARNERQAVYEKYRPALAYEGNVESGNEVFRDVCSECHRVGDMGSEVGPDLLSVVIRNRERLMTDILIPNESIEAGYEEYLLETNDGRSITGVMAAETPETVTLRRAKGEEDTIRRSNIASLRSLSVSPMPEDIEQGISVQGMADLLAYLKSL